MKTALDRKVELCAALLNMVKIILESDDAVHGECSVRRQMTEINNGRGFRDFKPTGETDYQILVTLKHKLPKLRT